MSRFAELSKDWPKTSELIPLNTDIASLSEKDAVILAQSVADQSEKMANIIQGLYSAIDADRGILDHDLPVAAVKYNSFREGSSEEFARSFQKNKDLFQTNLQHAIRGAPLLLAILEGFEYEIDGTITTTLLSAREAFLPLFQILYFQDVNIHLPESIPDVLIQFHRGLITRTLYNMVSNARKRGGAENVWIEAQQSNTEFTLTVKDDGKGIDEVLFDGDVTRIFQEGVSGHGSTGIGLGGLPKKLATFGASVGVEAHEGNARTIPEVSEEWEVYVANNDPSITVPKVGFSADLNLLKYIYKKICDKEWQDRGNYFDNLTGLERLLSKLWHISINDRQEERKALNKKLKEVIDQYFALETRTFVTPEKHLQGASFTLHFPVVSNI